eukprot:1374967-Amorphochlora_amoeboformis.AAC.1
MKNHSEQRREWDKCERESCLSGEYENQIRYREESGTNARGRAVCLENMDNMRKEQKLGRQYEKGTQGS